MWIAWFFSRDFFSLHYCVLIHFLACLTKQYAPWGSLARHAHSQLFEQFISKSFHSLFCLHTSTVAHSVCMRHHRTKTALRFLPPDFYRSWQSKYSFEMQRCENTPYIMFSLLACWLAEPLKNTSTDSNLNVHEPRQMICSWSVSKI